MPTQEAVEVDWRRLVHRLNQRYREEFDRAERLQSQLDHIRGSRAWRILCWWRRFKQWLWPMREADRFLRESREEFATCLPSQVSGTVSILIPFRDRVELLRNALAGLRRTSYRKFEIILIDNGSTASRTLRLLNRLQGRRRIRIVKCPGAFNFSRLCNRGAGRARGDYLLFLNNDIEVGEPDWLERMLQVARDPGVGVVGATLLYPDGTLQHAGIFPAASGEWRHAYRGLPGDLGGHQDELRHIRCVPAVTGACLLIRRDRFRELGGFDERLPVTLNDVDLCERVRRRGLLVAITPHARLIHYESLSRGYSSAENS